MGANLITFTIGNAEYQAEEGMTWEEWCDSEYNTESYFYAGVHVCNPNGFYISTVTPSDIIENGKSYVIASGGQ